MEPFADFYLGGHPHYSTDEVLTALFRSGGHRFSHRWTRLLEIRGEPAGLLLSFPGSKVLSLSAGLAFRLLQVYGPLGFVRLAARLVDYSGFREAESDEYYIAQLAILPGFQRRGLGSLLLEQAEAQALASGLLKCSLFVDSENAPALSLYQRHGYQVVGTETSRYPGFEIPRRVFFRMLKTLHEAAENSPAAISEASPGPHP